jgi:uncharacterized protein
MKYMKFLFIGIVFGIILTKSEAISWFRIQEMFRFQSFHLYGVIGSAILTGVVSIQLVKRLKIKTVNGEPVFVEPKRYHHGLFPGGFIFGLGWALTGACPGPLFALVGAGAYVIVVTVLGALAGTWVYALVRSRLPH